MEKKNSILLSRGLQTLSEKHFGKIYTRVAGELLGRPSVSISFSKGSPESYFICSGIVQEGIKRYGAKVVFKKRLENEESGPISSTCECSDWNATDHCSHVCTLFLSFYLIHEDKGDGQNIVLGNSSSFNPSPLGVSVKEYGTIVDGDEIRPSPNVPYSSLAYILCNKKVVNFPIPENFSGKMILDIRSVIFGRDKKKEDEDQKDFTIRFKYQNPKEEIIDEVSLFEMLYLFDWRNGRVYYLTRGLKEIVHQVKSRDANLNDLIRTILGLKEEWFELIVDGRRFDEIPIHWPSCKIHLMKGAKKGQLKFEIGFFDKKGVPTTLPAFLGAFAFYNGLLNTFKSKYTAYSFIDKFCDNPNGEAYKKFLFSSKDRSRWNELIDLVKSVPTTSLYSAKSKVLLHYENSFLLILVAAMYDCFGKMFFRFSHNIEGLSLVYNTTMSVVFQGMFEFYDKMLKFGVHIYYDKNEICRWRNSFHFERKNANIGGIDSNIEWFDLDLVVSEEDMKIIENVDEENQLAHTKKGLVLLTKKQSSILKFIKKYIIYEKEKTEKEKVDGKNVHRFTLPFKKARIFELFELQKLGVPGALTQEEVELCERLATMEEMPVYDIPEDFVDVLRPYQKTGYNWLRFLYENRLGACLADDMGLGKTLQTISFVKGIYDRVDKVLVVCPVTILLNWEQEFAKFSDIPVYTYHGEKRVYPHKCKVVITSYGVMKKEIDTTFKDLVFDIFILDEVQHLKNISSIGAVAARKIKAKFRVGLTGTPVENDLVEFYNILDLSLPGIWGDLSFIRSNSSKKSRLLARKTATPFILRRSKSKVLSELPPKIENNILLSFSDVEKNRYQQSLVKIKNKIVSSDSGRRYGEILKGLLELRQKCLWQVKSLYTKTDYNEIESTKIKFLLETLDQIVVEGNQALVFSQFTTYLDIIQHHMKDKNWDLARIDGSQSIKKRQQQVQLFQEGKRQIFLISLKAGGVGLNLATASYVFVMDPWWNPSVEQQAIDRAHRIGQKNTLTVYRPIIKDTVEEKVVELQKVKKELFYDLLPDDDDQIFTGKLKNQDFEALFA